MEIWTSSTTEEMSTVFAWCGVADFVGTLLIGPLFDYVNDMLLMSVCFLIEAVAIALAPMWPSLPPFQALVALNFGFGVGIFSGNCNEMSC